jgi:hypothetical protein
MTETTTETSSQDHDTTNTETKVVLVEVVNPSKEDMAGITEHINANFDFDVNSKAVTFNFKKSKDKDSGIITERKPVQLAVPYPSVQGILTILEAGGKGLELLIDAMETVVNSATRDLLYEDLTITASTLPVDKLSWEHIANIPKVQRRGGGIPKEVWEAFGADYVEVMPEATGKTEEQCANAAKLLVNKLSTVKTNKEVINFLVGVLATYAEHSPNIAEFSECVEFLLSKAEGLLNVSEEELLAAL